MRRGKNWFLILLIASTIVLFYVMVTYNLCVRCLTTNAENRAYVTSPPTDTVTHIQDEEKECFHGNLEYGKFCVISPYEEERNAKEEAVVTLCTQGTVEFLHHVAVLCYRWSGPISVAVYSPPDDYLEARGRVHALRYCDFCIRYWVSWHFFYPNQQIPEYIGSESPPDCNSITEEHISLTRRSQGTYPINVGRNIARSKAKTTFVFSTDIELYPSLGILPKFERMLRTSAPSKYPQVWAFPVFEVHSKLQAPMTKQELGKMFSTRQAVSFHKYRCNVCHKIPNLTQWISHKASAHSEVDESLEPLRVWTTVKRNRVFHLQSWEPFFIGTTADPEFDIRLSWEGKQNKMQVAYEMCLRNYDFHIIENAFLVHAPGINVYNASKDRERRKFILENDMWISKIKKNLSKTYGKTNAC